MRRKGRQSTSGLTPRESLGVDVGMEVLDLLLEAADASEGQAQGHGLGRR